LIVFLGSTQDFKISFEGLALTGKAFFYGRAERMHVLKRP